MTMAPVPKPDIARGMLEEDPVAALLEIIRVLRDRETGCPWTARQTHATLVPHLLEESMEVVEAIDAARCGDELKGELGDLLLQIVFHARIASEDGRFSLHDVARAICDKLIRRYPTILGDEPNTLRTEEEIVRRWEQVKAQERKQKAAAAAATATSISTTATPTSILDGVSTALPALVRAAKLKERAALEGWEWPDASMLLDKIAEEVGELRHEIENGGDMARIEAEFGDLLYMMSDFARYHGLDAENALRKTNNRFEKRFRYMEKRLAEAGKSIRNSSREDRRKFWDEAKSLE